MSVYEINYDQHGIELLPPDKRDSRTVALVKSLLKGVQWCRDSLFTSYKTGATAQPFAFGVYNKFDQVVYQKAVYYSLVDNNTDAPTTLNWLKIQDNFIGVDNRVKFNGQKLVLEFALNQQFNGVFRGPGSSSLSDIYLTNIAAVPTGYRIGQTDQATSTSGQTISSDSLGSRYSFVQVNNFQVNIKASLYAQTSVQAIREFVNLYIPISLNFTIQPY